MPAPRAQWVSVKMRATVDPTRPCTWLAVAMARQRATGRTFSARLRATGEGFLTVSLPATAAASALCEMVAVTAATNVTATATTTVIRTVRAMAAVVREAEEPLRLGVYQGRRCSGSGGWWQDKKAGRRLDGAPGGRSKSTALPSPLSGAASSPMRMSPTQTDGQAITTARLPRSCHRVPTPVCSLFGRLSAEPRLNYSCLHRLWAYTVKSASISASPPALSLFC